jgi:hypothetical protein
MFDALSAEWLKLTRHKASWFLVWLYPAGLLLIYALAITSGLAGGDPPQQPALDNWLRDTAMVWHVPSNTLGRSLIAAFVAVAFAGEYGWNTWKLIVPHRGRFSLIGAKYAVVLALFVAAFTLAAAISFAGSWLEDLASGDTVPGGVTVGAVLEVHGKAALAALAPGLITVGYASLASVLTRSTIAALVIAIVAITVEQLLFNFASLLSVKAPGLIWGLTHILPGYHLANIGNWIDPGAAVQLRLPPSGTVVLPWGVSVAAVLAWIAGLAALTFASFRRQDIN